jgi:hypothetical protein
MTIGLALASFGCSTTIRSMSARAWLETPGAAAAAPAAGAAAAAPAAGAAGALTSQFYMTYWEGSCGGFTFGCSRGDTKVKRCKVNADNSVVCYDEAAANKAFAVP